ncbi:MAG: TIR domain-containing protein [Rhodospirillales bacterium]|nr:TIR domain-containing protein [Rhodospirillales bacterium]
MPSTGQAPQSPTVFISYAHESEALRVSVKALADWLAGRGCTLLTDHAHQFRPPDIGWQAWMLGCIQQADTVLVVCTPKLKARYEKTAEPETGRGATYEGAIVTQHIYDNAMRNTKFFPILPEGGREDDIPITLRPWWNGHRFPSGNEGIRRMVFDEAGGTGSQRGAGADQERLAARLLDAAGALPFFQTLQGEVADEFPETSFPDTAAAMVQRFARSPADHVQRLFFVVRRALRAMPDGEAVGRRHAEEAAAALYFVAACRLVDQASHTAPATASEGNSYVLRVPSSEHLICAVIATALFGGELRLTPAEEPGIPRPKYVFEVKPPAGGDQIIEDFDRAVFFALFPNDKRAIAISQGSGPLAGKDLADLLAELDDIRHVQRHSLALVVKGLPRAGPHETFATRHRVPVMVPASEATTVLLGMDADRLAAEIKKLCEAFQVWPRQGSPSRPADDQQPSPPSGEAPMPSTGPSITVTGGSATIAISTGGHSAAQAGSAQTAHIDHRQGADLAELMALLQHLIEEIGKLPAGDGRDALTAHVELAQHEAGKKDQAEPGRIKRALDVVKSGAEGLEQGGKIIALCSEAYNALAPFLGLPQPPLP